MATNNYRMLMGAECPPSSSFLERLACILNYDGNRKEIWINYSLLGMNFLWCSLLCYYEIHKPLRLRMAATGRICVPDLRQMFNLYPSPVQSRMRFRFFSILVVALFQMGLCFVLGGSGISIIWGAMAGWAWPERSETLPPFRQEYINQRQLFGFLNYIRFCRIEWTILGLNALTVLFYLMVYPWKKSVALYCAVFLGLGIRYFENDYYVERRPRGTPIAVTDSI